MNITKEEEAVEIMKIGEDCVQNTKIKERKVLEKKIPGVIGEEEGEGGS